MLDVSMTMHSAGCCPWWMHTQAMRVPTATRTAASVRQRGRVPTADVTTIIMKIALSPTASHATVRPPRPSRLTVTKKHHTTNAASHGSWGVHGGLCLPRDELEGDAEDGDRRDGVQQAERLQRRDELLRPHEQHEDDGEHAEQRHARLILAKGVPASGGPPARGSPDEGRAYDTPSSMRRIPSRSSASADWWITRPAGLNDGSSAKSPSRQLEHRVERVLAAQRRPTAR